MEPTFTISILAEDKTYILNRIIIILTRKRIRIENITISESEFRDTFRYIIILHATIEKVARLVSQLEKLIEVIKVSAYQDIDLTCREIALYKISSSCLNDIKKTIRLAHARILEEDSNIITIEKSGCPAEIQLLFEELKPAGILEFVRSGRIAVTKCNN